METQQMGIVCFWRKKKSCDAYFLYV